jgi:hypothetical protein
MNKRSRFFKSKYFKVFVEYGIHLWIILFIANIALLYAVHFFIIGATCMTSQQVQADTSRCLYIYGNQVFNVGSQGNPHHGHPCGTDVTTAIPSSHVGNQASYLLPNYVADICSNGTPSTAPSISPVTVPSPGCLGGCPTLTPTPSMAASLAPSVSLALSTQPSAAPSSVLPSSGISLSLSGFPVNGDTNSIINFLKQLLQLIINLINSLGGNLSSRHGGSGGHHHHHHDHD